MLWARSFVVRHGEGVDLVASASPGVGVSPAPTHNASDDRRAAAHRDAAVETPPDLAGGGVERIHVTAHGTGVDDAVGHAQRSEVERGGGGIGRLPEDFASGGIESAP